MFYFSNSLSLSSNYFSINFRTYLLALRSNSSFILFLGNSLLALYELVASIIFSDSSKDTTRVWEMRQKHDKCVLQLQ